MKTIKLKRGDVISHAGKTYRMNKTIHANVTAEHQTDTTVTPRQEIPPPPIPEPVGRAKSDPAQGLSKARVLELIQEKIKVLEQHENKLLMEGIFDVDDDLELIDQQRGENYKTASYAATTVHIMDLKSLYKKVENLA